MIKVDHAQCIAFWGDETTYDHINLAIGQQVRLKTEGNSPIIESLTKLDTDQKLLASNYSGGDKTGQSWTDKVMNVRETVPNTSQEVEGVAEDEWDD